MSEKGIYSFYEEELGRLRSSGSLRSLRATGGRDGRYVELEGRRLINLSSNDYLGLATDREMITAFYGEMNPRDLTDRYGPGSTSSRLLTGNYPLYEEVEELITGMYRESLRDERGVDREPDREILVFNSGYHANSGLFAALAGEGDLILSDALNHASIIDGIRLSRADRETFPHRDYEYLEEILKRKRGRYRAVIIASESLFSMDGDEADLPRLAGIKRKYGALLYLDEAHAAGIYGERGLGIAEARGTLGDTDITVATFGKAYGSQGAYAAVPRPIRDFLVNRMRTLIFSTALPPVTMAWNLFILKKTSLLKERRDRLSVTASLLRDSLENRGLRTTGSRHIVPVIAGENRDAVAISERLIEEGFLLFPIRPPTVPRGTSRIRISLTSGIEWKEIEKIPALIRSAL